jgi:hypothetical protein
MKGLARTGLAAAGLVGFLLIWEALPRLGLLNGTLVRRPRPFRRRSPARSRPAYGSGRSGRA